MDGWSIIGAIGGIWRKSSAAHKQARTCTVGAAHAELWKYATLCTRRVAAEMKALRSLRRPYFRGGMPVPCFEGWIVDGLMDCH